MFTLINIKAEMSRKFHIKLPFCCFHPYQLVQCVPSSPNRSRKSILSADLQQLHVVHLDSPKTMFVFYALLNPEHLSANNEIKGLSEHSRNETANTN